MPSDAALPAVDRSSVLPGLARAVRPKQWAKNVLVFAAPGAAGVLSDPSALGRACAAFALFSVAAGGTYLLNDAADVESDRLHPVKRYRPVASGSVPIAVARSVGVLLVVGAVAGGWAVLGHRFGLLVAGYLALSTSYTIWLKHIEVVDLVAIAAGFVLRAIAGGVAVEVPISRWFFIVTSFGSLFVVAGKRSSEQRELGIDAGSVRATLGAYSGGYLVFVRSVTAGVALLAYCLWAFETGETKGGAVWFEISILPFTVGVLRYALLLEQGAGGAPEEIFLRDRVLLVVGMMWAVLFAVGVHGG